MATGAAAVGKLPPRRPAELSNSFIITTIQDLEPQLVNGQQQTPCEYAVRRARSIGTPTSCRTPPTGRHCSYCSSCGHEPSKLQQCYSIRGWAVPQLLGAVC